MVQGIRRRQGAGGKVLVDREEVIGGFLQESPGLGTIHHRNSVLVYGSSITEVISSKVGSQAGDNSHQGMSHPGSFRRERQFSDPAEEPSAPYYQES